MLNYKRNIKRIFLPIYSNQLFFNLQGALKAYYNSNIEINEKIFEHLNFKKCAICYAEAFKEKSYNLLEKKRILVERFGDFEFPIEPTQFYFKDIENTEIRTAFIYCMVFVVMTQNSK